jgi:hypothetical protein
VQGYGQRRTLVGSDPRWLNFPAERRDARAVADVVAQPFLSTSMIDVARRAGADYLFLLRGGDGYDPMTLGRLRARAPGAIVFESPDVAIVQLS